jgi:hypothetical protein
MLPRYAYQVAFLLPERLNGVTHNGGGGNGSKRRAAGGQSAPAADLARPAPRQATGQQGTDAELADLRARVAELEADAAHRTPVVELRAPAHRLRAELAALRKERDDLAEIRSYQPGIEAEAKAWLARIDRASRAIGETDDWPENN